MAVFQGSRYANESVTPIKFDSGEVKHYLHMRLQIRQEELNFDLVEDNVQEDEEFQDYAASVFAGRADRWWLLAEMNEVFFPYDLKLGQRTVLPSKALLDTLQNKGLI